MGILIADFKISKQGRNLLSLALSSKPTPSNPFHYLMSCNRYRLILYHDVLEIFDDWIDPATKLQPFEWSRWGFILWLNGLGSRQPQDPWRHETHLFSIYDISHPISILSPIRNLPQFCYTSQFIRDQEPRTKKNHKDNLEYRVQFWFSMLMSASKAVPLWLRSELKVSKVSFYLFFFPDRVDMEAW